MIGPKLPVNHTVTKNFKLVNGLTSKYSGPNDGPKVICKSYVD